MTKAEEEVYKLIFTNGKQMLSPEINSVDFHAITHEDTEILGMFCDFTAIHGEALKQLLIRGYLKKNPKAEIQGNWRRILIRNDKGGCIGARMICPVCNGDSGHDKYMKYCPNCGARLETHIMSEEGNRYSNLFITDDNFDENMEKLADENNFNYTQFITFLEKLPDGFTRQDNKNGYEEWVSVKTCPNHAIDCASPIVESIVAYEFANGFMLFGDRDSIYD